LMARVFDPLFTLTDRTRDDPLMRTSSEADQRDRPLDAHPARDELAERPR
jgi:hypothetical protein